VLSNAFNVSRNFAFGAWHAVQDMPDNIGADLRETFRLGVSSVLKKLTLLRGEAGHRRDDSEADNSESENLNGELLLGYVCINRRSALHVY
jgi:hypothetical protein